MGEGIRGINGNGENAIKKFFLELIKVGSGKPGIVFILEPIFRRQQEVQVSSGLQVLIAKACRRTGRGSGVDCSLLRGLRLIFRVLAHLRLSYQPAGDTAWWLVPVREAW